MAAPGQPLARFDLVAADPVDEVIIQPALHHLRWHHQRVAVQSGLDFDIDQLARPQALRGVVELSLGLDCAGGCRDLIVDQAKAALAQLRAATAGIADKGFDPGRLFGREQVVEQGQVLLGQGKLHGNGSDLGHGKQPLGIADP